MSKTNNPPRYKLLENSVLGTPLDKQRKVTILGAGISGLMMGYFLKKNGFEVEIFEINDKVGGILLTYDSEFGITENAAVSFRWGEQIIKLCDDLNIKIVQATETSNKKYFFRDGEFKRFPLSVLEATKTVYRLFFTKTNVPENLEEFGINHLSESALHFFLEPALQGIYGADSSSLSFPAVMPSMAKALNKNNRLAKEAFRIAFTKSKPKQVNKPLGFKNGMRDLVNGLHNYLKDEVHLKKTLRKEELAGKQVVLSMPASNAANFFDGEIKDLLRNVKYSQLVTAHVFVTTKSLRKFKPGFGCLVPKKNGLKTIGIIYNDFIFPERRSSNFMTNLTFIIKDKNGMLQKKSMSYLTELLYKEMKIIFDFDDVFLDLKIVKWEKALPVYSSDLYNSWFKINDILAKDYPDIKLFSNFTGNISMRGMCEDAAAYVEENLK